MSKNEPLATVVVAVNGDCRIYRLLTSLLGQSARAAGFEIVVVENGSSQFADVEAMGEGMVRYVNLPTANMAAARNAGLSRARGQHLLLTDADAVAHPGWVQAMTRRLNEGRYTAVGGAIRKLAPKTWVQRHGITIADGQGALNYLPVLPLPYVAGVNSGFVTAAVRSVGGFDEEFRSGNDVDLCYRLGLQGCQVGLAPDAIVWHDDRADVCGHFHRFRHYAVHQVLLFAKYRHISRQRVLINRYPFRRTAQALGAIPTILKSAAGGNPAPAMIATLQLIEAAAVWCGDVQGAVKFRQLYF